MSKERDCYSCDCFDHDYGSCTMPSPDRSYCCPLEDDDGLDYLKESECDINTEINISKTPDEKYVVKIGDREVLR